MFKFFKKQKNASTTSSSLAFSQIVFSNDPISHQSSKILQESISKIASNRNTVKVIIENLKSYLNHIDGIINNIRSISENLKTYFDQNSTFFQPFLIFYDQLRAIGMNLKHHFEDFRGFENQATPLEENFKIFENLLTEFNQKNKKFEHYRIKIQALKAEKEDFARRGKSISSKKINKILRVS